MKSAKKYYKLYKEYWLSSLPEGVVDAAKKAYEEYKQYEDDSISFEDFLVENNGFNGEMYASYENFLEIEFPEPEVLQELDAWEKNNK
jgi:hypothetical protein